MKFYDILENNGWRVRRELEKRNVIFVGLTKEKGKAIMLIEVRRNPSQFPPINAVVLFIDECFI